jgi:preprotein translocase subunit SecD
MKMRIEKISLITILLLMFVTSCASIKKNIELKGDSKVNGFYELDENGEEFRVLGEQDLRFKLKVTPTVSSDKIDRLEIVKGKDQYGSIHIDVFFTDKGTEDFEEFTRANMEKQIFYVVNGAIISYPRVMGVIDGGRTQYVIKEKYLDSMFIIP